MTPDNVATEIVVETDTVTDHEGTGTVDDNSRLNDGSGEESDGQVYLIVCYYKLATFQSIYLLFAQLHVHLIHCKK